MKSRKQQLREKRRRQLVRSRLGWIGAGLVVLAGLAYVIWASTRPAVGEVVAIMADTSHVAEGEDPGPYNSDPPTSGRHYDNTFTAGFYDETSPQAQATHPEGYLVHNLEHGYVIFWYNCQLLDEQDCQTLKSQIRQVLDDENNFKVIAFPRESISVPVVLTSWGKIQEFERFRPRAARDFVQRNRNQAPEPFAE